MSLTNRHPVDQLADVRAQMGVLKKQEDALKAEISHRMGASNALGGDEFIATQRVTTRKGALDQKAMTAAGLDIERFRKPDVTVYAITVERRASEVA